MKLEFLTEELRCLTPVLRDSRLLEDSAEAVLPDQCPEVREILHVGGNALLRGQETSEGRLTVSAAVSASALVQPDGAAVEVLEVYIPMSMTLEDPRLHAGHVLAVDLQLRRLEAHMSGPRKVQIRATVSVSVAVWERSGFSLPVSCSSDQVAVYRQKTPLQVLVEMSDKRYDLEDNVQITEPGNLETIADCEATVVHTDVRMTGSRAIFRSEIRLRVLYLDRDGALQVAQAELPYSQYIDLEEGAEEDQLILRTAITGLDTDRTAEGTLNLSIGLNTRAQVFARREAACITDLYALQGEVTPRWAERTMESLLDAKETELQGKTTLHGGEKILGVWCQPGEADVERDGEQVHISLPVSLRLLSRDGQQLRSDSGRITVTGTIHAAPDTVLRGNGLSLRGTASPGFEGVDIRVTGTLTMETIGVSRLTMVEDAEWTDTSPDPDRPGLVIRRSAPGETLWSLAKQYRTSVETISQANDLIGDPVPGTLLLIPG